MIWLYIIILIIAFIGIGVLFGAPYVPSHRKDIRRLFNEIIPISSKDTVLDLGSGDGLVLREVSRCGAQAVGYEIHPLFVIISKLFSVRDRHVSVKWANIWTAPFPNTVTVVYIFGVGRDGTKIIDKLQHETNQIGRSLILACYGNALPGIKPKQAAGAFYIYQFQPLH